MILHILHLITGTVTLLLSTTMRRLSTVKFVQADVVLEDWRFKVYEIVLVLGISYEKPIHNMGAAFNHN